MSVETYEKLPVQVTAYCWEGPQTHSAGKISPLTNTDLAAGMGPVCVWCDMGASHHGQMHVEDGLRRVCKGDMIVEGIEGCTYPVHSKVFGRTYKRRPANGS